MMNLGSDVLNLNLFIMSIMIGLPDMDPMTLRTSSWFISEKFLFLLCITMCFSGIDTGSVGLELFCGFGGCSDVGLVLVFEVGS